MTVPCSGLVWSCPLVSQRTNDFRIPHMDDKLHCTNYQLLASSPEIGSTNTFNLGGTWYLASWYWYQRFSLSPPSQKPSVVIKCAPCRLSTLFTCYKIQYFIRADFHTVRLSKRTEIHAIKCLWCITFCSNSKRNFLTINKTFLVCSVNLTERKSAFKDDTKNKNSLQSTLGIGNGGKAVIDARGDQYCSKQDATGAKSHQQ